MALWEKVVTLLRESTGILEAGITQRLWPIAGDLHGAIDFMSSLVRVTIRVSLVLGLNLSNGNVVSNSSTYAFDDSCIPNYQLHNNIFSSVFSSKANNTTENEPYDPGDVGNPNNGDGAGSR